MNGPDPVRFDRDVEIRNRENTRFAPFLAWIPQDPEGREPMLNQEKDKFAPGKFLKKAGEGDANYCAETTPLVMDSNAAAEFVREVARQYNATGPEVLIDPTFTYGGGRFPTDGEFVDALKIAKQLGMKEVSAAATCELGRDIVRLSRDPHTKGMKVKGNYRSPYAESEEKLGGDKTDRDFHNDLGAFIMYIGQNSLLYPAKHLIENGECDQRFIPETAAGVAGCTATPGMPGQFHFNNYASYTPVANGIYEAAYKPSIEAMGLGKITVNPPLQVLSAGKIGTEQYGYKDCGKISCASRSAKYREEIRLLLNEKEDFTAWEGNACEEFEGTSATIPIEQVLEYVQMVCENGLHLKPHGVGSSKVGVGGNKPVAKSNRDGKTPTVTLDNNRKN